MARFQLEDGAIVDTDRAACSWDEAIYWDGRNHISRATGDQFLHETLYKSSKGRYYIVHRSQWQGSGDHAEEITPMAAAAWLLRNELRNVHEYQADAAVLEDRNDYREYQLLLIRHCVGEHKFPLPIISNSITFNKEYK